MALGGHEVTKVTTMPEEGLLPLLSLASSLDLGCVSFAVYCLVLLSESDEVKATLVKLGSIVLIVSQSARLKDVEVKRNCGYFLSLLAEYMEFHDGLVREGRIECIVILASLEGIECQKYATTFNLTHLASSRDYQVRLVDCGVLWPLMSMVSVHAGPRHYVGLALLKLADNFENHIRLQKMGGAQTFLRLARARSAGEELQYKATLTVGHLSSNAVKLLPEGSLGSCNWLHFKYAKWCCMSIWFQSFDCSR